MSIATWILKVWELDVKPEASWDYVAQETTWMVMYSDIFSTCCPRVRNARSKAGSSPFLENLTSNVFAGHSPLWFRSLWRQSRIMFFCTFLLHLLSEQLQQWPGLLRLLAAPPFWNAVMTTRICILNFMRRKSFKHFYLVADIALVTVPCMTVWATNWSSSQNRPLILSPTCQRPPRTLFILRHFLGFLATALWAVNH